ncbi:cytochrome aa3-600 menaquinol oxidase subunit 4 [Geomicrobium halophilum]|uniref:Quinol oxidase subunit 4 n=1 Tax=Geomicrobium halophilum TaxID=549000 RepID=A0A841PUB8_9BACL|nr:cytochrome aa3 quinol oxidase subunit IV [Geomicrobium halophilum]MBB6450746.1 cytochrome aa3-600 menaquinol oxidase subunit 4 [Geomicrobium halophilum]
MNNNETLSQKERHFPWKHVVGFLTSIVLTLVALWIAFFSAFSVRTIVILIFSLAFVQAGLQLLMFMHMAESGSGRIQVGHILFSAFVAIIIALGSYWVMEFGIHLDHHM